jgi:exosortase
LFWWKRKELLSFSLDSWWPAIALVLFAALAHIAFYIAQFPQGSIAALFIGIYGLMGLAWGFRFLRASFFPFFLTVFCVPLGGYGQLITQPLRMLATQLVELICHVVLGLHVIRRGAMLIDPSGRYQYEVAAACGGIRSLVAILALATVFSFIVFQSPWKRLVMIASAFPLAVIGNVTRLMTIILAAEYGGQSAGDKVHDGGPFGVWSLLPYIPAIVGLVYLERLLNRNVRIEQKAAS